MRTFPNRTVVGVEPGRRRGVVMVLSQFRLTIGCLSRDWTVLSLRSQARTRRVGGNSKQRS